MQIKKRKIKLKENFQKSTKQKSAKHQTKITKLKRSEPLGLFWADSCHPPL